MTADSPAAAAPAGPPVIFLMGPTGAGKTELAVRLHERWPVDIISVDSAMVYRGMDIGTAKPSPAVRAAAPHRLIDICDPAEAYSAGRFREDALAAIRESRARGRIPLLVGGTGLYFRALERGMSDLPGASEGVRQTLKLEAEEAGWEQMHLKLAEIDPESARRIHPNDPQRIQRALEVYRVSGRPLSAFFAAGRTPALGGPVHKFVLAPRQRQALHTALRRRFLRMLDDELIEEVRCLYTRPDLHAGLPAMRLVGYRQVWQYLSGQLDYEDMIERAVAATRQLAKRQFTWLRGEGRAIWLDSGAGDVEGQLLHYIRDEATIP